MTPKQVRFLSELFQSSSVAEAIQKSGVAESTAYRWMRENDEFKREYNSRKTQALDEVATQMQVGFSEAVQKLMEIIRNDRVSAQVKVNAIDCLFRNAKPLMEEVNILNRLNEVEARIQAEQKEGDFDDASED